MTEPDLHALVLACFNECDAAAKVRRTRAAAARLLGGDFRPGAEWARTSPCDALVGRAGRGAGIGRIEQPDTPGRPTRPELVAPSGLARRGLQDAAGRAALIHAVAHIEFNAINLALDAMLRFPGMPADYYADWMRVAAEEAYHFSLMRERLQMLDHDYGDFPAHDGLWEMARRTAGDLLERMALVPRVLEARGLDVTPGMIERLRAVGDQDTALRLGIILRDEVGHVAIGGRWFRWLCEQRGLEPRETYLRLVREQFIERGRGRVVGPLNLPDRRRAGFDEIELAGLMAMCGGADKRAARP